MNFFIKILDDINEEKVSYYTAWYVQIIMRRYSEDNIRNMWVAVIDT